MNTHFIRSVWVLHLFGRTATKKPIIHLAHVSPRRMAYPSSRMSPITARVPPFSTVFHSTPPVDQGPQEVQTDRGPRSRRLRTSIPGEFALSPLPPPPGSVAASSAAFPGGGRRLRDSRSTLFMSPAIVSAISAELGVRTVTTETVLVCPHLAVPMRLHALFSLLVSTGI